MESYNNIAPELQAIYEPALRALAARTMLARLKLFEKIVGHYEALPHRTDIPDWRKEQLKTQLCEDYRKLAGVNVDQRRTFQKILMEVAKTGSRTVDEIIKTLRRDYMNGLSIDGDSTAGT